MLSRHPLCHLYWLSSIGHHPFNHTDAVEHRQEHSSSPCRSRLWFDWRDVKATMVAKQEHSLHSEQFHADQRQLSFNDSSVSWRATLEAETFRVNSVLADNSLSLLEGSR